MRHTLCKAAALALSLWAASALATPQDADAFCGFYVSGADEAMYNDATMVVLMREGTRTVLSMRNHYEGPPEDFALVIPVPEVLEEENVRTLRDEVFDRVDKLAAPRLVEYWEQDPCQLNAAYGFGGLGMIGTGRGGGGRATRGLDGLGVKVEAEFDVDEYNVVILSAEESNGLETWLKGNEYNIPDGAAPVLKPYVEQGLYFFVARVDPKKVEFEGGQATLSPLRFHYDSKDFFLPVRLGLINARGPQDLLVHVLAKGQRYEVANYPNATIPTNLVVKQDVRERFADFYATLFDRVTEENPGAVVTEYSWNAATCDPCPTPALRPNEIQELGADVMPVSSSGGGGRGLGGWGANSWVLTRLHARYTAKDMKEDLIFREAEPIIGGRGMPHGTRVIEDGVIGEQRAVPGPMNQFQGRYIMLNRWEGEVECERPLFGRWGGPTDGSAAKTEAAQDTAFAERGGVKLPEVVVTREVPSLGAIDAKPAAEAEAGAGASAESSDGEDEIIEEEGAKPATMTQGEPGDGQRKQRSSCATAPGAPVEAPLALLGLVGLVGLVGLARRRRR